MDNSAQLAEMVRDKINEEIMKSRNFMEIGISSNDTYWKEVGRLDAFRVTTEMIKEQLYKLNNEELEDDDD